MARSFAVSAPCFVVCAGLVAGLCVAPAQAAAPPPAWADPARTFHDGARSVTFTRMEGASVSGEMTVAPISLRYEGRSREIKAFVDNTAIVEIEPGAEADLAARGARIVKPLMPSIGLYLVEDVTGGDGIDVARRLQPGAPAASGIRRASPNLYFYRRAFGDYTPNDPKLPAQWYFKNLKMTEAWGLSRGDAGTSVVVIDSGCDMTHPDLKDKIDPGIDAIDGDMDPSPNVAEEGAAHGTACAGLIAASTDNSEGMAGACPDCRLRCVRLVNNMLVPESADIASFQFVLDSGAAVASNSWGFADPTPVPAMLADAINNVFDHGRGGKGAVVVFAMGNDDRVVADDELQAVRGVLAIGAINNLDAAAPFTNHGNSADLVVYTGTLSTDIVGAAGFDPGDYTSNFSGTSSSCPVAAGIAALLASAAPDKTSAEIVDVLLKTARPAPYAQPDANGHDPTYGYGIIDPVKALHALLDAGGSGGSGGGGGTGGAGGGTTSAGAGGTGGGAGSGGSGAKEGGGCSCRLTGQGNGSGQSLFVLSGVAIAAAAMRRRRLRSRRWIG